MNDKKRDKEQEEWVRLVHEGACCSYEDPMKEEKKSFLKDLAKKQKSKHQESK